MNKKLFERYIKNKEEPCVAVVRKGYLIDKITDAFLHFWVRDNYGSNNL